MKTYHSLLKPLFYVSFFVACTLLAPHVAASDTKTWTASKAKASVFREFKDLEYGRRTGAVLDELVRRGIAELRQRNYVAKAFQYETEWNGEFKHHFSGIQIMELGDHEPLFQWLDEFTRFLNIVVPAPILVRLELDRLWILNYSIPVVFQPSGDRRNGDTWDRDEYKNHFVPFAGTVTYLAIKFGCEAAVHEDILCRISGTAGEWGMMLFIAPPISDLIYDHFGGPSRPRNP